MCGQFIDGGSPSTSISEQRRISWKGPKKVNSSFRPTPYIRKNFDDAPTGRFLSGFHRPSRPTFDHTQWQAREEAREKRRQDWKKNSKPVDSSFRPTPY